MTSSRSKSVHCVHNRLALSSLRSGSLQNKSWRRASSRLPDRGEILVIEDDDDFRNLVANHLRRAGYQVRGLRDGRAAADFIASAQLRDRPPAAVVSDISQMRACPRCCEMQSDPVLAEPTATSGARRHRAGGPAGIADVRMPGFDGLALLAAIRQARWTTPVILMTGFGLADPEAAERHDALAVLSKPFQMSELDALLDVAIGVPFGLQAGSV
jgi:DNA-binding NtrC family response regulator